MNLEMMATSAKLRVMKVKYTGDEMVMMATVVL